MLTDGLRRGAALGALLALSAAPSALAQEIRLGHEFQVNSFTAGYQFQARGVVALAEGDFAVVWTDEGAGSTWDIRGRRFSGSGDPLGTELQINAYPAFLAGARPAADADGDLVVVWSRFSSAGFFDVFARRVSSTGVPLTDELLVNEFTPDRQSHASVASSDDGAFVVAWSGLGANGSSYGVFARRFSSGGDRLASELEVSDYSLGFQRHPVVAMAADGGFVIAWKGFAYGSGFDTYEGVFARRFSSFGDPIGGRFEVSTRGVHQYAYTRPVVATDTAGGFVVAWNGHTEGVVGLQILARRFSSDGTALGSELQVNTATTFWLELPSIAADADGDFVVAWQSRSQDGSKEGVFARRVSRDGIPIGGELQVNAYTLDDQLGPAVAMHADGDFVVAWTSAEQDGSDWGVFAQRFASGFTPTATPTITPSVTPMSATPTPTMVTPPPPIELYGIPTLSAEAMAALAFLLVGICLALLRTGRS